MGRGDFIQRVRPLENQRTRDTQPRYQRTNVRDTQPRYQRAREPARKERIERSQQAEESCRANIAAHGAEIAALRAKTDALKARQRNEAQDAKEEADRKAEQQRTRAEAARKAQQQRTRAKIAKE